MGKTSDKVDIKAGIPQGSRLDPLLVFLIYMNDITENTESDILIFADDTFFYVLTCKNHLYYTDK